MKKKYKKRDKEEFIDKLGNVIVAVLLVMICIWFISVYSKATDMETRLILLPFLLCTIAATGYKLANVLGFFIVEAILRKTYVAIFLITMVIFSAFSTIIMIKEENNIIAGLYVSPFWIGCICVFYRYFIKKD